MEVSERRCRHKYTRGESTGVVCGKLCKGDLDYCNTHRDCAAARRDRKLLLEKSTGIHKVTHAKTQQDKLNRLKQPSDYETFKNSFKADREEYKGRDVHVYLFVGEPGSGKTYNMHDWCNAEKKTFYKITPKTKGTKLNFDGYKGEEVLMIDEMGPWMDMEFFKQLIDKYPVQLPNSKHEAMEAKYTYVLITTNIPIDKWFRRRGDDSDDDTAMVQYRSIKRRIHLCMQCKHIDNEYYADEVKL